MSENWVVVDEIAGEGPAEILAGLLQAQGVSVLLSHEGLASTYAVNIGQLGRVQILVPDDQRETARQILEEYYQGEFSDGDKPAGRPYGAEEDDDDDELAEEA